MQKKERKRRRNEIMDDFEKVNEDPVLIKTEIEKERCANIFVYLNGKQRENLNKLYKLNKL